MQLIKSLFFSFVFLCCIYLQAGEIERSWLIKEELISPAIEHFDCHGSNIIETSPGNLCVVWQGGPLEGLCNVDGKNNIGIWISHFENGAWKKPQELLSSPDTVYWPAVLCKLHTEELLLFYRTGPNPRNVKSFIKRSKDSGHTWSEEELLPAGIVGPTKTKPLVLHAGALISPSSNEVGDPTEKNKATACYIEISEDEGHCWRKIGPMEIPGRKFGVIEPTLYMSSQGQLKMFCRDRAHKIGGVGYVWTAFSNDFGKSWSSLIPISLPNPDSGLDIVNLGGGKAILFYNHSHTNRFPLSCAISFDDATTWSAPFVLETACGEFPSAIISSDGLIHVTYAYASPGKTQRRIKHVVIDPNKLIQEVISP